MVDGKCCPRCPCPCNSEGTATRHSESASRRSGGASGGERAGAGSAGHPLTSTPNTQRASLNRLEQTRERLESLVQSSRGSDAGGSHSNTLTMNELMILRRKLQILETRLAALEERLSSGGSHRQDGSERIHSSSRSLEILKRNVIQAVSLEFDQF